MAKRRPARISPEPTPVAEEPVESGPFSCAPPAPPSPPSPRESAAAPARPSAAAAPAPASPRAVPQSRFGGFIQTYSSFLSSFVIGAAGLIATTQYQWNQAKIAAKQAESQIRITEAQADNSWRIERAKILSQNLQVLSAQGSGNVEQRYGVLLSLTRGNILDSELAVSYALELGKENPEYMRSVLANTKEKDYRRLASAFVVTCEQRYGLSRAVDACKGDKQQERGAALVEVLSEEIETALQQGKLGPLALLQEEREVVANLARFLWLFTPFVTDQYERRQWEQIERFAQVSSAARLIAALAVLSIKNGVYVTNGESQQIQRYHEEHRRFLAAFLLGTGCDNECRGRIAGVMLSAFQRAGGDFDAAMMAVLSRPRVETTATLSRLNQRLLLCQVAEPDAVALRDQALVPLLLTALNAAQPDAARIDDLLGLLAQVPELAPPAPPAAPGAKTPADAAKDAANLKDLKDPKDSGSRWRALLAQLQRVEGGRYQKLLAERRAQRSRAQKLLTPNLRKASFCNVSGVTIEADVEE